MNKLEIINKISTLYSDILMDFICLDIMNNDILDVEGNIVDTKNYKPHQINNDTSKILEFYNKNDNITDAVYEIAADFINENLDIVNKFYDLCHQDYLNNFESNDICELELDISLKCINYIGFTPYKLKEKYLQKYRTKFGEIFGYN